MLQRKRRTQENTGPAWLNNLNSTRLSHLMPWNLELYVNRVEIKLLSQCNSIYTSNMPFSFFAVLVRLLGYIDSRTFIYLQWTSLRWWPLPEVVWQTQLVKSESHVSLYQDALILPQHNLCKTSTTPSSAPFWTVTNTSFALCYSEENWPLILTRSHDCSLILLSHLAVQAAIFCGSTMCLKTPPPF